jgi:hypothetical protein
MFSASQPRTNRAYLLPVDDASAQTTTALSAVGMAFVLAGGRDARLVFAHADQANGHQAIQG